MLTRRSVRYIGHVQGVGFRATVERIALRHAVKGYVRNMPDGSVELVLEGHAEPIEAVLSEVQQRMEQYLRDAKSDASPATGEFTGFAIRY